MSAIANPASTSSLPYAAFLGIDWANRSHALSLREAQSDRSEQRVISATPQSVHSFAEEISKRFDNQPIAVGVEMSKGALIEELSNYCCFELFPINPATSTRYRKAFKPSGAKDDLPDAEIHQEIVRVHREHLRPLQPKADLDRRLDALTRSRRKLCNQKRDLTNKLRDNLKDYFPLALEVSGSDLGAPMACDFLLRWPDLRSLKRARSKTLRDFYHAKGSRSSTKIEQRLEQIASAVAVTENSAVNEPMAAYTCALVRMIQILNDQVSEFDAQIKSAFDQHPDQALWLSFPGAGDVMAPRLAAAWTQDRQRWSDVTDIQLYTATAPVTEKSGDTSWVHRRWSRPKFLHQTFWEYANHSVNHCRWAKAFVQAQLAKGKKRSTALRALAFKWQRIMFRCWKNATLYDDASYEEALRKRRSPLAQWPSNDA